MEPGARWNIDPCVPSPPRKWWRFTRPAKPRPLLTPITSTLSFGLNWSTSTLSPSLKSPSPVSRWNSRRNLLPSAPAFLRWPVAGLLIRCGLTNSTSPSCMASYPSVVGVLRCTTVHGPALSRVTGTACPSGRNICVIPIFLPRIPGLILKLSAFSSQLSAPLSDRPRTRLTAGSLFPKRLDFDVHTGRQVELHQRIDRLLGRLQDVQEPFVRPDFKLLARLLIHVRRAQNSCDTAGSRQRNRTGDCCAGPFRGVHDFRRRLIQHTVIVCLQTDANSLSKGHYDLPNEKQLLNDLGNRTGAYRAAAFANREAQPLVHGHRSDQFHLQAHIVPRHHHLRAFRQLRHSRHVRRAEVELRPVSLEEQIGRACPIGRASCS